MHVFRTLKDSSSTLCECRHKTPWKRTRRIRSGFDREHLGFSGSLRPGAGARKTGLQALVFLASGCQRHRGRLSQCILPTHVKQLVNIRCALPGFMQTHMRIFSRLIDRFAVKIFEPGLYCTCRNEYVSGIIRLSCRHAPFLAFLVELLHTRPDACGIAIHYDNQRNPCMKSAILGQKFRELLQDKTCAGTPAFGRFFDSRRPPQVQSLLTETPCKRFVLRVLAQHRNRHSSAPAHFSQPLATISDRARPPESKTGSNRFAIAGPDFSRSSNTPHSPPR